MGKMMYDKELFFTHRGKGDLGIWKEQSAWKPILKDLTNSDCILDLGAHIGLFPIFTRRFSKSNPFIYSFEPDPDNFSILQVNKTINHIIENMAVVDDENISEIDLYLGKTYPAANSIIPVRGRKKITVKTVQWSKILKSIEPTIIKCDIEGAEYLLDWKKLPLSVKHIGFEFHFFKKYQEEEMYKIRNQLRDLGFKEIRIPKFNSYTKVTFGIYER